MTVETHHVSVGGDDRGSFRLVEYFDGVASPWVLTRVVLACATAMLGTCLQASGCDVSISATIVAVLVVLHVVLFLTGVTM